MRIPYHETMPIHVASPDLKCTLTLHYPNNYVTADDACRQGERLRDC